MKKKYIDIALDPKMRKLMSGKEDYTNDMMLFARNEVAEFLIFTLAGLDAGGTNEEFEEFVYHVVEGKKDIETLPFFVKAKGAIKHVYNETKEPIA